MARADFHRDSQGIAEILKTNCASVIAQLTEQVASNARSLHPDAEDIGVEHDTTDRARGTVVVRDVRARGWQVKDGFLSKAAAQAGLEVTEYGR